jgi:hypothetical protein
VSSHSQIAVGGAKAHRKVFEFLKRAERDADLRARVKAVQIDDKRSAFVELARIAESAGYAVSPEALESGLRECLPGELSEAQLDGIAGGVFSCDGMESVAVFSNEQSYSISCNSLGAGLQNSAFSGFYAQLGGKL